MDISVVITTCNRPAFLKEALEGIAAQTFKPKEVVIVNDCSDTSYNAVLDTIKKVNARHILLKERSGANRARNIGIRECSGGIIAFLDDDDIWLPNYLSEIYRQYQDGSDSVVTGFRQLGNESIVVLNQDSDVTKSSLLRGNTYCGMSGFSCKKEIIEKLLFDEQLPNGQDWDMFVRLLLGNYNFKNISKGLFLYRFQNVDGIGAKLRTLKPEDVVHRLASANKHREFLGDYWYKKRVCDQVLFSLKHKKNRLSWIVLAVRLTGFKVTAKFFFNMVKRKMLNKPMSI